VINAVQNYMKNCDSSPQRRRGRRECNYIFLLKWQKCINCREQGFFVFRPLTGKQNSLNLCILCASAVKCILVPAIPG
jgi:hypothetical protein